MAFPEWPPTDTNEGALSVSELKGSDLEVSDLRVSDDELLIGFGGRGMVGAMAGETVSDWFRPLDRLQSVEGPSYFGSLGRRQFGGVLAGRGLVGNLVGDNLVFRALSFLFFRGGPSKLVSPLLRFLGIIVRIIPVIAPLVL